MKSQTRIAIVFSLVTLAFMMVLSSVVYYFVTRYASNDFYRRLETRATLAARITLESESNTSALREMREQILQKLPQERDYLYEIKPGVNFETESRALNLPLSFFTNTAEGNVSEYRKDQLFFVGVRYENKGRSFISIASAENYYYSHHLENLKRVLLAAMIGGALLVFSTAIIFSRYVLFPVRQISRQVKEIGTQNLHLRLRTTIKSDAINELKTTFNNMLDRLETSFATQNNFISNASHELGTPLTVIIGEADVALSKTRTPEEYKEALTSILHEADRLERITKSLLFLAQTGFDGKKTKMEILRADQLLWDVKETIDKLYPKSKVHIDLSLVPDNPLKLKIKGNAQLLILAISNIVSNACKYSSNQPVRVSVATTNNEVIIVVKDNGIGIPESELPYIYDPFFRASNTNNFEGYGIGLPLARNIMRLHRGTILVTSKPDQGTTVRLTFPLEIIASYYNV
jgi:signal transduction histidine kinase